MKILTNYDFNKNQLLNPVIQKLATPPANPVSGQIYYDTAENRLFTYNGTEWVGADALDATMTGSDIVTAINASETLIDDNNLSAEVNDAISNSHTHSNSTVLANTTASFLTAQETKLGFISVTQAVDLDTLESDTALNNAKVTNATHTGDVTGSGELTIANGAVTLEKMANMATASFIGRNTASTGVPEVLSVATAKTMLGLVLTQTANTTGFSIAGGTASKTLTVANSMTLEGTDDSTLNIGSGGTLGTGAFASAYSHPTGDGNLHVPATGTSNNDKVLTAGGTAGSLSWATPTVAWADVSSKPTSTVANIDDAVSKRHSQNTDTGTSSSTFTIGNSGVKVKNSGGTELQVRNNADNDYADLRVKNLIVEGTTTTINSETVELADNQLLLNSNITTSAGNENGGIAVKRLMADNTTRKDAEVYYDTTDERWKTKQGAVTGTLVSATIANKVTAQIGNGALTSIPVVHNLNTRDCTVLVRETASPYAMVITDVEFTDLNTVTFKFAVAPTSNQYTVTIIG